jgi:hypothetical protein
MKKRHAFKPQFGIKLKGAAGVVGAGGHWKRNRCLNNSSPRPSAQAVFAEVQP